MEALVARVRLNDVLFHRHLVNAAIVVADLLEALAVRAPQVGVRVLKCKNGDCLTTAVGHRFVDVYEAVS